MLSFSCAIFCCIFKFSCSICFFKAFNSFCLFISFLFWSCSVLANSSLASTAILFSFSSLCFCSSTNSCACKDNTCSYCSYSCLVAVFSLFSNSKLSFFSLSVFFIAFWACSLYLLSCIIFSKYAFTLSVSIFTFIFTLTYWSSCSFVKELASKTVILDIESAKLLNSSFVI